MYDYTTDDERDYEEISDALYAFNTGETYNPFNWIGWVITDNGDTSIIVETEDGKFIARFANSPVAELHAFMARLEEGLA